MTFEEFLKKVDDFFMSGQIARPKPNEPISISNQLRYGQSVMNVLYNVWPEKYAQITGSDIDCFYDNGIIKLTLDALEKDWEKR